MNKQYEISTFFRSFAVMSKAGISLSRTFELLNSDLVGSKLGEASKSMALTIEQGASLPLAMKQHRQLFSPLQLSLTELACETGSLVIVLDSLAKHAEKQSALRSKLQSALTYPVILLIGCLLFVTIIPSILFQQLFSLLKDRQAELPWHTKTIMFVSQSLSNPWVLLGLTLSIILVAATFRQWYRRAQNRHFCSKTLEALPILGSALKSARLNSFSEALAISVNHGLRIDRGLALASQASGSELLVAKIPEMKSGIQDGLNVTDALERVALFPSLFLESIRAGEESGELGTMCNFLAGIYAAELEYNLERFTAMLEPLALMLMGSIVGIMAISCIQPLSDTLNSF